jgi:hypothetical protein
MIKQNENSINLPLQIYLDLAIFYVENEKYIVNYFYYLFLKKYISINFLT